MTGQRKMEEYFETVKSVVDSEASFLNEVSQEIWKHPELKFEETFAHDFLTKALDDKGFDVQKNYLLPTAFRAEFESGKSGPTVAFLCEYDALPTIGHACGHNLIAEAGVGAGLAVKIAMEEHSEISGKVVVLGTPAEEGGGGKVKMIVGGAFEDIDVSLMVHPSPTDYLYPQIVAISGMNISYTGKESHAAGFPWEGVNALDAAVACYNNVSLFRQQMKPACRVHCNIIKGGDATNVISGYSELQILYRAPTTSDMATLKKKLFDCVNSAALATGCKVEINEDIDTVYQALITNRVLAELYKKYAEQLGVSFQDGNHKLIPVLASSDVGDVSHVVPTIEPVYSICTEAPNHSVGFTEASGKQEAQDRTLITAKSMAMVAITILTDSAVLEDAKKQFEADLVENAA